MLRPAYLDHHTAASSYTPALRYPARPHWNERLAAGQFARRLAVLTHPSLLVVDEIGYLPVSHSGAVLFFQLMNRRYEHASTILTSNKNFEEWGAVLGDEVMAAALIDRVLHRCHLVNIRGKSFRMREHTTLRQSALAHLETPITSRQSRRNRASATG